MIAGRLWIVLGFAFCLGATALAEEDYVELGQDHFRQGRFKESVADFDKAIAADSKRGPYLWQLGIALYYAGEYERGAKQFESHRTVNPNDVENAAWHFLCVAKTSGVAQARRRLIPTADDQRTPMAEIFAMFAGKQTAADVMSAVQTMQGTPQAKRQATFYAHLYVGLYEEALGEAESARQHIEESVKLADEMNYMGDVAQIHLKEMEKRKAATKPTK